MHRRRNDEDSSLNCPHCDEPDSREHRLIYCKGLAKHREPFTPAFEWLTRQGKAVAHYGLCPYDDEWIRSKALLGDHQVPFVIPECDDKSWHVFTDGSAEFQQQWEYAIAGSAVVILDAFMSNNCSKCLQTPLKGPNQNSYRAEVQAILICLNEVWLPCIYSDCMAAVTIFQRMIHQASRGCAQFYCEDWDLWSKIWQHITTRPVGSLRIFHVEAHRGS